MSRTSPTSTSRSREFLRARRSAPRTYSFLERFGALGAGAEGGGVASALRALADRRLRQQRLRLVRRSRRQGRGRHRAAGRGAARGRRPGAAARDRGHRDRPGRGRRRRHHRRRRAHRDRRRRPRAAVATWARSSRSRAHRRQGRVRHPPPPQQDEQGLASSQRTFRSTRWPSAPTRPCSSPPRSTSSTRRVLAVGFSAPPTLLDPTDPEAIAAAVAEHFPEAKVLATDGHDWVADPFSRGGWNVHRPRPADPLPRFAAGTRGPPLLRRRRHRGALDRLVRRSFGERRPRRRAGLAAARLFLMSADTNIRNS